MRISGQPRLYGEDGENNNMDDIKVPAVNGATDLYEMGEAVAHQRRCGCGDCKKMELLIVRDLGPGLVELGFTFYKSNSKGVQLRAIMEGWTVEQVRDALAPTPAQAA